MRRLYNVHLGVGTFTVRTVERAPIRMRDAGVEVSPKLSALGHQRHLVDQSIERVFRYNSHLAMTVLWKSGGARLYSGAMSPGGLLIDGFTQNISIPGSTATWSTARQFQCVGSHSRAQ